VTWTAHTSPDLAPPAGPYSHVITKPYPVRTTVGSTLAGILVEIDVVAARRTA
jgi:2-iminobutanoate/2-iminopropanoate deaminase